MRQKLLQQDAAWFDATDSSNILVRVTQSARAARTVIDIVVTTLIRDTLTLVGLLVVMVWQNALLSAVFLLVVPLALLVVYFGVQPNAILSMSQASVDGKPVCSAEIICAEQKV